MTGVSKNPERCHTCNDTPHPSDPALVKQNGKMVCCFCGYWGIFPGREREELRRKRMEQQQLTMPPGPLR